MTLTFYKNGYKDKLVQVLVQYKKHKLQLHKILIQQIYLTILQLNLENK